jgi:hypothetical protein
MSRKLLVLDWGYRPTNIDTARQLCESYMTTLGKNNIWKVVIVPPLLLVPEVVVCASFARASVLVGSPCVTQNSLLGTSGSVSGELLTNIGCDYVLISCDNILPTPDTLNTVFINSLIPIFSFPQSKTSFTILLKVVEDLAVLFKCQKTQISTFIDIPFILIVDTDKTEYGDLASMEKLFNHLRLTLSSTLGDSTVIKLLLRSSEFTHNTHEYINATAIDGFYLSDQSFDGEFIDSLFSISLMNPGSVAFS